MRKKPFNLDEVRFFFPGAIMFGYQNFPYEISQIDFNFQFLLCFFFFALIFLALNTEPAQIHGLSIFFFEKH